ncbi:hypothetical protein [Desulfoscipio sp. XC116]|uniref:hypothetical protein n=1 Tax=Desulfoscipio sp. XC116 TaxID=3144975 RepID=UPI00325BB5DA
MKYRFVFNLLQLFLAALLITALPQTAIADSNKQGHFIILVVDQISLEDLTNSDLPHFKTIIKEGAIAVMNTSTGGAQTPDNSFVTIGTGNRAVGYPAASQAFNAKDELNGEPVTGIYMRRTNNVEVNPENIISLTVEQIKTLNEDQHYTVDIGALGEALHRAGIKTSVIGNSDMPPEDAIFPKYIYGRQAVTLLMDNRGLVDYGDISNNTNITDYTAPFGIRANEEKIVDLFRQHYAHSQVLLINFGDTSRTAVYASAPGEKTANHHLQQSLIRADNLLGQLLKNINLNKDCLAVVAPTPSTINKNLKDTLTPVILTGSGIAPGLLTSSTTHRRGIVANIDLASTVLKYFYIDRPSTMIGESISVENADQNEKLRFMTDLKAKLVNNTIRRVPILSTVAYYILAVLAFSLVLSVLRLFNVDISNILKRTLFYNFLAILTLPLALLIMGTFGAINILLSFITLVAIVIVLTVIMSFLYKHFNIETSILFICLSFLILLFFDLFTGANIILNSPLGYDPQRGARFYGIGNELMGAVIGASTLGLAAFLDLKRFRGQIAMVGLVMAGILLIMVFPGLGSKAGASISVTAAFVTLFWLSMGYRTGKKQLLIVIAAVFSVLAFISIADSLGVPKTHVGRAIKDIQSSGLTSMLDIIVRKLEMDLRLMRYSYWSGVLVASIFLMLLMFKFRLNFLEHLRINTPNILNGCYAGLFGAAVALFTNDAGIVAAATAVIYPVFSLLLFNLYPSHYNELE